MSNNNTPTGGKNPPGVSSWSRGVREVTSRLTHPARETPGSALRGREPSEGPDLSHPSGASSWSRDMREATSRLTHPAHEAPGSALRGREQSEALDLSITSPGHMIGSSVVTWLQRL